MKTSEIKNVWDKNPQPKKINNEIEVCWDADSDPENIKDWHVVIWTGKDIIKGDCSKWDDGKRPCRLSTKEVKKLRDWLDEFLIETGNY